MVSCLLAIVGLMPKRGLVMGSLFEERCVFCTDSWICRSVEWI